MYSYKRMVVGLNLNENDPVLIREAARMASLAGTDNVSYLHVLEVQEIPPDIKKQYPQLITPFREMAEEKIKTAVSDNSREKGGFECLIKEGRPVKTILEEIRNQDADILVIGRNFSNRRSNRKNTENLTRKAPCSVYIVPAEFKTREIKKIMIASDGSVHSKNALEEAVNLAKALGINSVTCLNVYHVPLGFHSTGKSYEEFAEIMLKNAKAEYEDMIKGFDAKGLEIKPLFELNDHIEKGILDAAGKEKTDILVVGARGRSTGASVLLGSVTEHLIGNIDIPLIAVKNKSAGVAFFDALLNVL